ncbi:hypothetical protein PtA15_11A405 [Puccinia triticina]|uniref:Uncharacterized protein n=1 Tax=Puccinia triticina TaxID=208348 RepID=A0ABY7CWN8_9BASI|nr:uncharacterized protein PtA15_11A405 [Puccinia triticina]WAQ89714.1 hypothetical protein PtA15_11A405 [Puccinia triticina]WAR59759.1 hypothetical protein PtB15_11B400 [Puccinia triticina]
MTKGDYITSLQARAASRQVQTVLRRPAESCRLTPSLNHPADWSTRSVDQVKFSYAPLQLHRCKGACSLLSDDQPSVIASLQARAARRQVQTVLRRPAESYRLTPSHKHPADWSTSLPPSPSSPPTGSDCSPTPRRVLWTDSKPQAPRRLVDEPSVIASLQARAARRQVQTVLRRPAESYRLTPSHKHPADWSTSLPPSPSSPPTGSDCSPTPRRVLWTDSKPQAPRRLVDEPPSKPEHPADTFRLFRLFYDAPPSLVDCLQATSTRPTGPRDN